MLNIDENKTNAYINNNVKYLIKITNLKYIYISTTKNLFHHKNHHLTHF